MEFRETENLLDVLTQHETFGFCRYVFNRLKFYRTKTWAIMTENQPDISSEDRNRNQKAKDYMAAFGGSAGGSEGVASIPASTKQTK